MKTLRTKTRGPVVMMIQTRKLFSIHLPSHPVLSLLMNYHQYTRFGMYLIQSRHLQKGETVGVTLFFIMMLTHCAILSLMLVVLDLLHTGLWKTVRPVPLLPTLQYKTQPVWRNLPLLCNNSKLWLLQKLIFFNTCLDFRKHRSTSIFKITW